MSISGSWGLVLDLGDNPAESVLQKLYAAVWDAPEFSGPKFKMGEYLSLPRAAEGGLSLPGSGQSGSSYTKFDADNLGYPMGWQVPLSFQLSVYGFGENLPANQELYRFLLTKARQFAGLSYFRMAVICELSCYYLNAEFLNEAWLDLQQQSVLALILPERHPFTRQHPGQTWEKGMFLYERPELEPFWTEADEATRYTHFKRRLSEELHSPKQTSLEWESPSQN